MKKNRPLNEEKRKAIIKASIREFYEKGFEGSSMDTISKEANVSKATVYNHFKNKEELFIAITEILKDRLYESFKYTYNKDKPIEEQLYEMGKQELDFLIDEENITLIKIATIVMIQKNQIGLKVLETVKDDCMITVAQWFDDAKKDGKLDFESSSFVSRQFIGMIKSFVLYQQFYGAPTLPKEEHENLLKQAVNMIKVLYKK
ncbi:MAG: TetR family transcriptional regulator [Arcobacter sp.]|nr:MAG: TetR family transcriptional regulator [Arcobacter sp.]